MKWPLALGISIIAVGCALFGTSHDELWQVMLAIIVMGVGGPLSFAAAASLMVEAVHESQTGIATGIQHVIRMIGAACGAQIAAAILAGQTLGSSNVPTEDAFSRVFWTFALIAAVFGATALLITPRAAGRKPLALAEAGP
jgi:MFS family permease